jgi:Grx4 family monothiol glutaredoxin
MINCIFQYEVTAVPTILFLDSTGSILDRIDGGEDVAKVTQCYARLSNSSSYESPLDAAATTVQSQKSALHTRLGQLVASSPIMLFMKGTPSSPRCGFSRQACEILTSHNLHFGYFDILEDDDVRQGLKEYSDWPTYPQLYVRGELMGGLDIMKEMVDSGDFVEQLDVKEFVTKAGVDGSSGGEEATSSTDTTSLNQKLHQLVNRHRIMLFMKGIPSSPRCGFSRQIVEILDSFNVSYDAFNILEDEQVRQGLKEYSDWPTYPQLYVEGDLVGGLDIVKEMVESGDLKDLLTGDAKD